MALILSRKRLHDACPCEEGKHFVPHIQKGSAFIGLTPLIFSVPLALGLCFRVEARSKTCPRIHKVNRS